MNPCLENTLEHIDNYTVFDGYAKAINVLNRSVSALCSLSGESDSDIVLDIIHNTDELEKVRYFWIDTGLEYEATKKHLSFLEEKYSIEIMRAKPEKPIPLCVKEYGIPFLSKYVSEQMMRLQKHNFKWEDEPLEVLLKKYPNCKTALQWWCNSYYTAENGVCRMSRYSISRNRFLKEFIMENPPDFPISNKCCEYAKKKSAKKLIKESGCDLEITGIRKYEGGIRSANYTSCFSANSSKGCNTYRPLFWYTDADKKYYEEHFGICHSDCYTKYGMKRTGCAGCPFNPKITEELELIKKFEPKLYNASYNIFGKSYDYTRRYREFVKVKKEEEKQKRAISL